MEEFECDPFDSPCSSLRPALEPARETFLEVLRSLELFRRSPDATSIGLDPSSRYVRTTFRTSCSEPFEERKLKDTPGLSPGGAGHATSSRRASWSIAGPLSAYGQRLLFIRNAELLKRVKYHGGTKSGGDGL